MLDQVAAQGGVVGVELDQDLVDLRLGVLQTRLEALRQEVEHHEQLAVLGGDRVQPSVGVQEVAQLRTRSLMGLTVRRR